jgi:hypothetical protein
VFRLAQQPITVPEKLRVAEGVGLDDASAQRVVFEVDLRRDSLFVIIGETRGLDFDQLVLGVVFEVLDRVCSRLLLDQVAVFVVFEALFCRESARREQC